MVRRWGGLSRDLSIYDLAFDDTLIDRELLIATALSSVMRTTGVTVASVAQIATGCVSRFTSV
jgi:hypothetical protein